MMKHFLERNFRNRKRAQSALQSSPLPPFLQSALGENESIAPTMSSIYMYSEQNNTGNNNNNNNNKQPTNVY